MRLPDGGGERAWDHVQRGPAAECPHSAVGAEPAARASPKTTLAGSAGVNWDVFALRSMSAPVSSAAEVSYCLSSLRQLSSAVFRVDVCRHAKRSLEYLPSSNPPDSAAVRCTSLNDRGHMIRSEAEVAEERNCLKVASFAPIGLLRRHAEPARSSGGRGGPGARSRLGRRRRPSLAR